MFLPTAVIFGVWAFVAGKTLWVWWEVLIVMIPLYVLFSWLANLTSLISMQRAPNIWYSLMISKSYVVLTALIAIPLLGSSFSWIDGLSITLIIWFMSLILLDPNKSNVVSWPSFGRIIPAIYACVWRAWLALSSGWFLQRWVDPLVINFWIFFIVSVVMVLESLISQKTIRPPRQSLLPAFGVVASMVVFNRSLQKWYEIAPNPWYINAANASSIALLTLVSSWIFKDELNVRKFIGIVGVVVGISLLFVF